MKSFTFIPTARSLIQKIWKNRQTLWMMIERDFRSRYVGSTAGLLWSVIHPLLMVGIYTLIFSLVFGRQIGNAPFALWLFCGLLPWIMFSEILKNSSGVLEKHRNLITKTPFHPEILSLVVIGSSLTGHLIGFAVLLALISVFSQPPGVMILSVGLYLTCLILFVLGLSWFISSVNIFFRDVAQGVNVVLQLWFYLTPIIYPSSIIPENYRVLLRLNPMYFITEGYRKALLTGEGIAMTDFVYFTTLTLLVLFGGGWVFRRLKTQFAEIL